MVCLMLIALPPRLTAPGWLAIRDPRFFGGWHFNSDRSLPGRCLRLSMRPSTTSTTTLADDATDADIAALAEQPGGESRMQIPRDAD